MDSCCPICTEAFSEPKGLPCFHTFCQACLQLYIDRCADNKSFKCPVCKKKTLPFDSEKLKSEWAKSFPTNNYVINPEIVGCPIHFNKAMNINCKTCSIIICSQCCLSTHENCEKILTEINAEKIKKTLLLHQDKLKLKLEFLEERLSKMPDKITTESNVKKSSQQLISFINKQKKTHFNNLKTNYSNESARLQKKKEDIVECMKNLKENIDDLKNLVGDQNTEDRSLNQVTFDYKPKHILINKMSDFIQPDKETDDFIINPNFVKLKDDILKLDMVEKFNNLTPTFSIADEETNEDEDASVMGHGSVDEMPPLSLTLMDTVIISGHSIPTINDMIMLRDQCFLLTDACYKKIWKFSVSGEYLKDIYFDQEPFGLCLLENDSVAVSQPSIKKIIILDCEDLTEKDSLSFEKSYYGLGSNDRTRIFALYRDKYICVDIISKSDLESSYEISHSVKLPFTSSIFRRLRILPSGDILIFVYNILWNLCCVNQNGEVVFLYEGDEDNSLEYISDVAVSTHFIYIADKTTNVIHRIQHQGDFVDIPLTSAEIMAQPKKIYVNDEGVLAMFFNNKENYKIQLFSS